MERLSDRIISLIKQGDTTYEAIQERGRARGLSPEEIDRALMTVHKDKRVKTDGHSYSYREPVVKQPFVQNWEYPWPGKNGVPEFVMPWPEWNLAHLFLSPEEAEEYRATIKGCPPQKGRFKKKYSTSYATTTSSTGGRTTNHSGTRTSTAGEAVIGLT